MPIILVSYVGKKEQIMKKYKRIFTIVVDSFGVGEALNASDYNDVGADTLASI